MEGNIWMQDSCTNLYMQDHLNLALQITIQAGFLLMSVRRFKEANNRKSYYWAINAVGETQDDRFNGVILEVNI